MNPWAETVPAAAIAIDTLIGACVLRVPADATVADVAKAITDHNVGAVIVGDESRPTALVSERDVVRVVAGAEIPVPSRLARSRAPDWCGVRPTTPWRRPRSG